MDKNSQLKVIREGFTILRKDNKPKPRIKAKNRENTNWHTFASFETITSRDAAFKKLTELSFVIID